MTVDENLILMKTLDGHMEFPGLGYVREETCQSGESILAGTA